MCLPHGYDDTLKNKVDELIKKLKKEEVQEVKEPEMVVPC